MPFHFLPRNNKYFDQFIQLPSYKQIFIFLIIAASLVGFWLTFIYFNIQNAIDFYVLQKQNMENKINLMQCSTNDLEKLNKNIQSSAAQLTQYKKANTKENDLTLIIKQANKLNIAITSCNQKHKPCEKKWYTQHNIALTLQGTLENITSFFKTINSIAICGYSPCTITHENNNLFQMSCTLTYLTIHDEIAATQPQKLLTGMYDEEQNQEMANDLTA